MEWMVATSLLIAVTSSLLLVWVVRAVARRIGFVDRPDADRKVHEKPVALGGGVAVYLAVATTFALALIIDRYSGANVLGYLRGPWYQLFAGAFAMLVVGLVDDAWALRGRQKLLCQMIIVGMMIGSDTVIRQIGFFGIDIQLGILAIPVTMLWLLASVNALNLIDGADGMASTVGMIIAGGLGLLAFAVGSPLVGLIGISLAGALFGFLCFNKPPASIYLGDAGSMMIGLFVGTIAVWSSFKETAALASAPMAILAIPLLDSTAAIVRRRLTGRSIYQTDRGHMHHLLQLKYGPIGMLVVVGTACLATTAIAVLSTFFQAPWIAALGVIAVVGWLIKTRSFGHSELRLIYNRAAHFAESFMMHPEKCTSEKQKTSLQLQGSAAWELVWEPLVDFAVKHDLAKMKIDISMAWLHESFHATWQRVRLPERAEQLVMEVPLFAERIADGKTVQIPVGKLSLIAPGANTSVYGRIEEFLERLEESKAPITKIMLDLEKASMKDRKHEETKAELPNAPITTSADPVAVAADQTAEAGH